MAATDTLPPKRTKRKKWGASTAELESFHDIADDVIESDFVPYACLFDSGTIATKDGELVQTIKVTGLSYDSTVRNDLRSAIREAIHTAIPDETYAIWLHTLRRKQAAQARARYPDSFSGKLDEAWRAGQSSSLSYTNELYITIVKASGSSSLRNFRVLKESIIPARDQRQRIRVMDTSLKAINAVTGNMVKLLSAFGARQLKLVERGGIFYSEQLEFLEKLINLEERPMPVPERDLSHVLTSSEITFGFNAMEVRSAAGVRRFAAILTLKEYKESTLAGIDKFLEIPCEVIVSQCFDFTDGDIARETYEKQARYLNYSGDTELAKWMEIDRLRNLDGKSFGQQQTSIFLIAASVTQLETNVRSVQRALNRLGMVIVREDLRFEECYWSQLPANFPFISRKYAVDTEHLAGFANLQAAPMGRAAGSPWGQAVTTFTTLQDAPYYFNFHRGPSAHTVVLGNATYSATPFAHLLLTQARKLPLNLWYLDITGTAAPLIEAMGGESFNVGDAHCTLSPLQLPDTPPNREFLALWLSTLIDETGYNLNRSTLAFLQHIVGEVMKLPREARRMPFVVAQIREADRAIAATLQRFVAGNAYGDLFDNPQDTFAGGKLTGWNIARWMHDPVTRTPLSGYLLHRINGLLKQAPTLLILNDGFQILDTPLFNARIGGWCDYLTQHNAAAMLISNDVEASAVPAFSSVFASKAATIFATADRHAGPGYATGFHFTGDALTSLAVINGEQSQILQKRGTEMVVLKTHLDHLPSHLLNTLKGVVPQQSSAKSAAEQLAELMGYDKQAV